MNSGLVVLLIAGFLFIVGVVLALMEIGVAGGLLILASPILVVIGVVLLLRRDRKTGLLGGTLTQGTAMGEFLADTLDRRSIADRSFEVYYQTPIRGKNGRPALLTVRVPLETPTSVQFHREGWFDRLGKRLGIAREVQTGDGRFDDAVYVRASAPDYASRYLDDADKRTAIQALLAAGFDEVRLTKTAAEALWPAFDPSSHGRAGLADDAGAALLVLSERTPPIEPDFVEPADVSRVWYILLWIGLGLYAASAIGCFLFSPLYGAELFWGGVQSFFGSFAILAVFSGLLLRGKSVSHDRWRWILIVGSALLLVGSLGSFATLNAVFDDAPIDERTVVINTTRISRGNRGNVTYYAVVSDWNHPGKTIEFRISESEHRRIRNGQSKLILKIGHGWYDMPWIRSQVVRP